MTNQQKRNLIQLCKQGYSLKEIKEIMVGDCCDSTIRNYMYIFSKKKKGDI